jgi:hypothetical protein
VSSKNESLSDHENAVLLARLAHTLTICARDTYEAGTERVLEPEILRAYNELSHRVTGAVVNHLLGHDGYSPELILEMIRDFGKTRNRMNEMEWAVDFAARKGTS